MKRLHGSKATIDDVCAALDRSGYAIVAGPLSPEEAREKRAALTEVLRAIVSRRSSVVRGMS